MLGLTYGIPVMTIESYPDALAAFRLGLPTPSQHELGAPPRSTSDLAIYHFDHTADPIYMGSCNTVFSSCTLAGYAIESMCHTSVPYINSQPAHKGITPYLGIDPAFAGPPLYPQWQESSTTSCQQQPIRGWRRRESSTQGSRESSSSSLRSSD